MRARFGRVSGLGAVLLLGSLLLGPLLPANLLPAERSPGAFLPHPLSAQAVPPPTGPTAAGEGGVGASALPGSLPQALAPGASRWFPATRLFRAPIASPTEPGFRGAALSTDLLRGDALDAERPPPQVKGLREGGRDFQGVVSLGESYPLRRFGQGTGPEGAQLGVMVGVTARFRLATAANEYLASDWIVGLPLEFARGPVSGRAVLFHRSAHLGDEIMEEAGVRRVGFGHEGLSLLLAGSPLHPLRVYGGGTRLFRSETSGTLEELGRSWDDGWEVQAGVELERGLPEWGSRLAAFSAVELLAAERTDWRAQWSALAGVAFRAGSRSGRVALRLLHGPSMHGEFFLTPETAWGLEFRLTR